MYYCDNENRTDDMGKLGENELPETVPEWCPLRKDWMWMYGKNKRYWRKETNYCI